MKNFRNLMKMLTLALSAFVFFISVSAQERSSEKTGALLWKITGNGLEHPSYIFGTHHLFPLSFLDSVAGVKQAFVESSQMIGELVMSDMEMLGVELQKAGMMPKDTTWQMLLAEDDYLFVDEQLTAFFGVGLQALSMLKPAMVSMTYSVMFYQKTFPGMNPGEAVDVWFQQQAWAREIPVVGLETVHEQTAALFDVISLKQQAEDLICTLKNTEHALYAARKMNRLYRSADLAAMAEILREESPCPMSAEQEAAINNERNRRWLEKLPILMADKPSFVAVGCLHLAGEAGILTGLEKLGYTVEAIHRITDF